MISIAKKIVVYFLGERFIDYCMSERNKNCLVCGKELVGFNQSKFCSRECYYVSRQGTKRPEVGKKIASSLKGQNHTEERKLNIKNAKEERAFKKWNILSDIDILKIEDVLKEGYSSELKNIMIASGVNKGYRSLHYYIKKNKDWFDSFSVVKFNPTDIQQWNVNKWRDFKSDLVELGLNKICAKYNLLERKVINLCNRNNLPLPVNDSRYTYFSKVSQKLFWEVYNDLPNELKSHTYFAELNKEFRYSLNEYHRRGLEINNKEYNFDFCIIYNKIAFIIEFNGDLWHANPRFFKEDDHPNYFYPDLTAREIWKRDECRENCVLSMNGILIPIWEYDYKHYKQEVLDIIQMYINMVFYNSENKSLRSF